MLEVDQLAQLLADLGEQLPGIDSIAQHGSSASWAIALENDLVFELELIDDGAVVLFACDLGAPPADAQLPVYEAVLQYNMASSATGGVALALSEPGGSLVELFRLSAADATLPNLQAVLQSLAAKAELWRSIIKSGAAGQDEPDAGESLLSSGLRV
jgi:hypothetical protein